MCSRISEKLQNLHSFLSQNDAVLDSAGCGEELAVLIGEIHVLFKEDIFEKSDIVFSVSQVMRSENDLVKFYEKIKAIKQLTDPKRQLLTLLKYLYESFPLHLEDDDVSAKNICMSLFMREKDSDIRGSAIKVIEMILRSRKDEPEVCEKLEISKLFEALFKLYYQQSFRLSSYVQGSILRLLGLILGRYGSLYEDKKCDDLLNILLQSIETEISKKEKRLELNIVDGAVVGLSEMLTCQQVSSFVSLSGDRLHKIYVLVFAIASPGEDLNKYDVCRSTLALIERHSWLLSSQIFSNYKFVFETLMRDVNHDNRDLQRLGRKALESVFKVLVKEIGLQAENIQSRDCFWFFVNNFIETMESSSLPVKNVALSIRGFGYFATLSSSYMKDSEKSTLVQNLVQQCQLLFSESKEDLKVSIPYLPSVIYALSSVAMDGNEMLDDLVEKLQFYHNIAFMYFLFTSSFIYDELIMSLVRCYIMLHRNNRLNEFLSKTMSNSLLHTISDAPIKSLATESSSLAYEPGTDHAYEDYIYVWKNLFNPYFFQDISDSEIQISVTKCIFGSVLDSIIDLINGLDLSMEMEITKENSEEEQRSWKAKKPKDYELLYNILNFSVLFIDNSSDYVDYIKSWVNVFLPALVKLSIKNPKIGGFYEVIASVISVCRKLDILVKDVFHLYLRDFVSECIKNLKLLNDELMSACLTMLLAIAHYGFLSSLEYKRCLSFGFRFGTTYLPLANVAFQSLEDVIRSQFYDIEDILVDILPEINPYVVLNVENMGVEARNKPKKSFSKRTIKTKADDFDTEKLRIRALKFLGSVYGVNQSIISDPWKTSSASDSFTKLAWDPLKKVRLTLPLNGSRLELYLDSLIPDICQLALHSSVRTVKIHACEFLHAAVLLIIGSQFTGVRQIHSSSQGAFDKLLENIFPVILNLATDIDPVAKQLFRPLSIQLIHLYTKDLDNCGSESIIFLNSCFDAVCNQDNPGLSEFGADCMEEFLKYSIKQESRLNIEFFWNRISSFLTHFSLQKRKGAAIAFNRIYRIFREDETLVSDTLFEFLGNLFYALKLNFQSLDPFAKEVSKSLEISLNHIKRILRVRQSLFLKPSVSRRNFVGLEEQTLEGLSDWLFTEIVDPTSVEYCRISRDFLLFILSILGKYDRDSWFKSKPLEFFKRFLEKTKVFRSKVRTSSFLNWIASSFNGDTLNLVLDLYADERNVNQIFLSKDDCNLEDTSIYVEFLCTLVKGDVSQFQRFLNIDACNFEDVCHFIVRKMTDLSQMGMVQSNNDLFREKIHSSIVKIFDVLGSNSQTHPIFPKLATLIRESISWESIKSQLLNSFGPDVVNRMEQFSKACQVSLYNLDYKEESSMVDLIVEMGTESEEQPLKATIVSIIIEQCVPLNPTLLARFFQEFKGLVSFPDEKMFLKFYGRFRDKILPILDKHAQLLLPALLGENSNDSHLCIKLLLDLAQSYYLTDVGFFLAMVLDAKISSIDLKLKLEFCIHSMLKYKGRELDPVCIELMSKITTESIKRESSWSLKAKGLDLFGIIIGKISPEKRKPLLSSVDLFITTCMPFSSKDIEKNSKEKEVYALCVERLLKALATSKDPHFFSIMLPFLCHDKNHFMRSKMHDAIQKYAKCVENQSLLEVVGNCMETIFDEDRFDIEVRERVCDLVLVPYIMKLPMVYFLKFCAKYLERIIKCIEPVLISTIEDAQLEEAFRIRSIVFKVLTIIYDRVGPEILNGTVPLFNGAIKGNKTGKQLTVELIKICFRDKSSVFRAVPGKLSFNQTSFILLCSIMICTQSKSAAFDGFIFKEDTGKNHFFWDKIVDPLVVYRFPVEVKKDEETVDDSQVDSKMKKSVKNISSQYFLDSSFSQGFIDTNQMDAEDETNDNIQNESIKTLKLDSDSINDMALMKTLVKCILKLVSLSNVEGNQSKNCEKSLYDSFNHHPLRPNAQLFICKMIINTSGIFSWDGRMWIGNLLEFVVSKNGFSDADSGINSFLLDFSLLILKFLGGMSREEIACHSNMLQRFMDLVISKSPHKRHFIMANSIKLIQKFAKYHDTFTPSLEEILKLMSNPVNEFRFAGFQVAEIFLKCKIDYFCESLEFRNILLSVLSTDTKSYVSELIGCFLDYLKSKSLQSVYDSFATNVVKRLKKLGSDTFIKSMAIIGKTDPAILAPFYQSDFLNATSMLFGKTKTYALESILYNAKSIPDLWHELIARGFLETLKRRDAVTQKLCLQILREIIDSLTEDQVCQIIPNLMHGFENHPDNDCIDLHLELLQSAYVKIKKDDKLLKETKIGLIRGSLIASETRKSAIFEIFLSKYDKNNPAIAFVYLLRDTFETEIEHIFIKFYNSLVLYLLQSNSSFQEMLFRSGFTNNIFGEMRIVTNVGISTASSSSNNFASTLEDSADNFDRSLILATQSQLLFSQTQIGITDGESAVIAASSLSQTEDAYSVKTKFLDKEFQDDSQFFKDKAEQKARISARLKRRSKIDKFNKVNIYRKYRIGELPDIEIKPSDILVPAFALANIDGTSSKLVFLAFWEAVFKELMKTPAHIKEFYVSIIKILSRIESQNSLLVASMLHLYQEIFSLSDDLKIVDSMVVFNASLRSGNLELGVLCLEKSLSFEDRGKSLHLTEHKNRTWIDLARIYGDLGMNDYLMSILKYHCNFSKSSIDGLSLEMNGKLEMATLAYQSEGTELTMEEQEITSLRAIECYEKLGRWGVVTSALESTVENNLSSLWDEDLRDSCLPKFLRSNINISIEEKRITPSLSKFISESMLDDMKRRSLTSVHSNELAISSILQGDIGEAAFYVKKAYESFSRFWDACDQQSVSRKRNLLNTLTKTVFLDNLVSSFKTKDYQFDWLLKVPHKSWDSLSQWLDFHYLRHLALDIHQVPAGINDLFIADLCSVAVREGNGYLAKGLFPMIKDKSSRTLLETASYIKSLNDNNQKLHIANLTAKYLEIKDLKDNYEISVQILSLLIESWDTNPKETSVIVAAKIGSPKTEIEIKRYLEDSYVTNFRKIDLCGKPQEIMNYYKFCMKSKRMDLRISLVSVICGYLKKADQKGMKTNTLFLLLLELSSSHPELKAEITSNVSGIPHSFVSPWIPQLAANICDESFVNFAPILKEICEFNGFSVNIALKISREQVLDSGEKSIPDCNMELLNELLLKTSNPINERLINELALLESPELQLKRHFTRIITLIEREDCKSLTLEWQQLESNLLSSSNRREEIYRSFSSKYRTAIQNVTGVKGEKLLLKYNSKSSLNQFRKDLMALASKIAGESAKEVRKEPLRKYSIWLSEFKSLNFERELILPGDDLMEPLKVSSFDPDLLVLSSLRKPKRIKIICTDESERYFLVKHGEDLRLDQRIQQVIKIMNSFTFDSDCNTVETYGVIPLTFDMGLIEWVDGCKSLLSCVQEQYSISKNVSLKVAQADLRKAQEIYHNWFEKKGLSKGQDESCKKMKQLESQFPKDLLRRHIYRLCSSPEAFLVLRQRLCKSLAAMNVYHYVLGIGDRHLDNFLLSERTGSVIGIDFGHAFGSASLHLAIPEVVPFRWTSQLEGLVDPLGSQVALKPTMTKVLLILESSKDYILSVLEVFVKEPLFEWNEIVSNSCTTDDDDNGRKSVVSKSVVSKSTVSKSAVSKSAVSKSVVSKSSSNKSDSSSWYPAERIDAVKEKLSLTESPCNIVIKELGKRRNRKKGLPTSSSTYSIPDDCKSVVNALEHIKTLHSQDSSDKASAIADELLYLASDPWVLAHSYVGWQPWL